MKKIALLALALVTLFCFTACEPKDIMEAKHKVYSTEGMSITMPGGFQEVEMLGVTTSYHSTDVTVFVLREVVSDISLAEYAQAVYEANEYREPGRITEIEGLTTMEYSFYNAAGMDMVCYFATMFEGPDAFWLIQFACDDAHYEEYKPHFIEWAKTVTFED